MKKFGKIILLTLTLLLFGFTSSSEFLSIQKVEASSIVITKKTTYQTTSNLKLRTGASVKNKAILTIRKGKIVTTTTQKGSWYKVAYTYSSKGKKVTKTGWVSGQYLKEYNKIVKTPGTYYFTKTSTPLYLSPDTKKKATIRIPANNGLYSNQKVLNSIGKTWYKVSYKGKSYYVYPSYIKKFTPFKFKKTAYKAKRDTYLYQSYGTIYSKLIKIPKGTVVSSTSGVGSWYKTSYTGKNGYIHKSSFIKTSEPVVIETAISNKVFLVNTNVILKSGAWEGAATLSTIPQGKFILPTHKVSNGWYKVNYAEKTGYVAGSHIQEVRTGSQITSRSGYQFIDLRTKSPVTASQIDTYIANFVNANDKKSVLTGKGQSFIDAGNKYGLNALYLAAHAIHESGYGTSNISFGKYNLFGFGAYDATPYIGAFRFKSIEQNIDYIARAMKATYLNPGNWKYKGAYLGYSTKTLSNARIDSSSEGMNYFYASDPYWGKVIASHMQKILPYDKTYYQSAKPNLTVFSAPPIPTGKDTFPSGILATAKQNLKVTDAAGKVKTLEKDTEFLLLEKANDFKVKIQLDDEIYWTKDIKFDRYKEFISVKNLGRALTSSLNVRPDPSTDKAAISTLKLNQYVHIVTDKEGNQVMDSSKNWYKIKLSNGTTGWVSAYYIARELE
ncbi:SH3 domain-containing protein [Mesobacillus subterraneus]|uniref:Peptide-binding protein n=1 Tax=Mesobacillus subterraneus TaxID=285983 RepID=A0A3R9E5Y3_9BACI|nr:SH3 domain-containing protein [Mesobacillus subterraneus]RSD21125.1 peptide-binding protein [Mesobacillus subterraneus]